MPRSSEKVIQGMAVAREAQSGAPTGRPIADHAISEVEAFIANNREDRSGFFSRVILWEFDITPDHTAERVGVLRERKNDCQCKEEDWNGSQASFHFH